MIVDEGIVPGAGDGAAGSSRTGNSAGGALWAAANDETIIIIRQTSVNCRSMLTARAVETSSTMRMQDSSDSEAVSLTAKKLFYVLWCERNARNGNGQLSIKASSISGSYAQRARAIVQFVFVEFCRWKDKNSERDRDAWHDRGIKMKRCKFARNGEGHHERSRAGQAGKSICKI